MPEGDTVWRTARTLDRALSGQLLTGTDFRVPTLATVDLSGQTVQQTLARGKHLLTRIGEDHTLHTHLKMEGSWHLYKPDSRWRRPAHEARVVLRTQPWTAVGLALGVVELVGRSEEDRVVGHLGPDLLGPDWDEDEALHRLLSDPARTVGDALLDQRNLAGIGNMYKAEICFLTGRGPVAPGRRGARPAPTHPASPPAARGQQGTRGADHDRRPAPWPPAVGLSPRPAAVPSLRHADPGPDAGVGHPGACHVLVPALPARAALTRTGWGSLSGWGGWWTGSPPHATGQRGHP